MSEERRGAPILNPVLMLRKEAVPEQPAVGGQGEDGIVQERLTPQRRRLSLDLERIAASADELPSHDNKIQVLATMYADSLAPSWTPKGLFSARHDCRLTTPAPGGGYLVEIDTRRLRDLAAYVRSTKTIEGRTAISRVKSIKPYYGTEILRGRTIQELWNDADEIEGGRAFIIWLMPFRDDGARASVVQTLNRIESERRILPTFSNVRFPTLPLRPARDGLPLVVSDDQTTIGRLIRRYRNKSAARAFIVVPNPDALGEVVASGASFRIDPVRRVEVNAPAIGAEPAPPVPSPTAQPIVAVIDGGLTAESYIALEVWRAPPLIAGRMADSTHGNRVTSLVIQGYAWNKQLKLPGLNCRIGTVQAVARPRSNAAVNTDMLIQYLRRVARNYPDARIWNMSFNQILPEVDPDLVSFLGHEIHEIAREFDILPIISIGNRISGESDIRLCPPADCEAALTVGGRRDDGNGNPAEPCSVCRVGPGPEGMLKPELSWYSRVRMLGGGVHTGSSYAAPLIASLAAHTYGNLKEPSPDLVRALLIDRAENEAHHRSLGFGTPYHGYEPWVCEPGSVTMTWRAKLVPGFAYYWHDIPIPPELIRDGKLFGKAKLTAVLNPLVSGSGGPNYFSTRLQVALQYVQRSGQIGNLLGSMRESTESEQIARAELAKWQPVRRHSRDFTRRGGIAFKGDAMRLHARVFARDLYQFGVTSQRELGEQDVAFVLTLKGDSTDSSIYNSTAQRLQNFVESAVIDQEIELTA